MSRTSVLNTFWPLLKVLQILGGFPIKKSKETLCGFKAITSCVYIISYNKPDAIILCIIELYPQ